MESSADTNLQSQEVSPAGVGELILTSSPPHSKFKAKELCKFLERDLGCSRSFLVCFLWRIWQHLQVLKGHVDVMTISFSEEMLNDWSEQAKYDSLDSSAVLVGRFGGMEPSESVPGCFWVTPTNFDPWWNLCKQSRSYYAMINALLNAARTECQFDNKREAFLLQVAALLTNIKSHDKIRRGDLGNKEIIQVNLPFAMPKRSIVSPHYYTHIDIDELEERFAEKKPKAASSSSPRARSRRHGDKKRKRVADDEDEAADEAEEDKGKEDEIVYNMQEDAGVHEEVFEDLLDLHEEDDEDEATQESTEGRMQVEVKQEIEVKEEVESK